MAQVAIAAAAEGKVGEGRPEDHRQILYMDG